MRLLRDYSLSLALAGLFIVSWLLQSVSGWVEFTAEQASHGDSAQLFGPTGYIWRWMESTFENWQSEFLQLFTMVVLTAFLVHRASHESRDSDDEVKSSLKTIQERLERMEGSRTRPRRRSNG